MSLDRYLDKWKAVPVRTRGLALIAAITALLVGMAGAEQIKRVTGQEIILPAAPVDPRDLLRGAYVQLDYPVTRVEISALDAPPDFEALRGKDHFYLVLRDQEPEGWRVVRVLPSPPPPARGPSEVVLQAKLRAWSRLPKPNEAPPTELMFQLGASRYFADERTAKALGDSLREKTMKVVLSVGRDGAPTIKGLVIDGARRDETLF